MPRNNFIVQSAAPMQRRPSERNWRTLDLELSKSTVKATLAAFDAFVKGCHENVHKTFRMSFRLVRIFNGGQDVKAEVIVLLDRAPTRLERVTAQRDKLVAALRDMIFAVPLCVFAGRISERECVTKAKAVLSEVLGTEVK